MDKQLRAWARTGEYQEDILPMRSDGPRRSLIRTRGPWIPRGPWLVLLIPIGVGVGLLLAASMLVRLLAVPFQRAGGTQD